MLKQAPRELTLTWTFTEFSFFITQSNQTHELVLPWDTHLWMLQNNRHETKYIYALDIVLTR